jgi:hypothetical protein
MGLLFLIGIRMVLAGFYMVCVNRCVNHLDEEKTQKFIDKNSDVNTKQILTNDSFCSIEQKNKCFY